MKLHLHNWSVWSIPYIDQWGGEGKLLQVRYCTICGLVHVTRCKEPTFSRSAISVVCEMLNTLQGETK